MDELLAAEKAAEKAVEKAVLMDGKVVASRVVRLVALIEYEELHIENKYKKDMPINVIIE